MARAAFVADQITRKIGLSGRAFIPLLIGFGCNVSSVLAARDNSRSGGPYSHQRYEPFLCLVPLD
jgi:Fe2+ transport system protein B